MSYFEHTKADLGKQRAAGLIEGRRDLSDLFLALASDTSRKLDSEKYDRGYVVEDLLARIVELATGMGGDPTLLPGLREFVRHTHAYPLLAIRPHAFEAAHSPGSCTAMVEDADGFGDVCGLPPNAPIHDVAAKQENTIDLTDAIRSAWEAQTFNGIPRHEHVGSADDRCYRSFDGRKCNEYWGHAVHETDFEQRSKRA